MSSKRKINITSTCIQIILVITMFIFLIGFLFGYYSNPHTNEFTEDEFKLLCLNNFSQINNFDNLTSNDNLDIKDSISQYSLNEVRSLCRKSQGVWINDFLDCEYIPQELCTELGGEFDNCSSACRNDPNAWVCTRECVPVCDFSNTTFQQINNAEVEDEEELKIYDSYQNIVPNNCSNWFDGCNNCILTQGGLLACTLKYCPEESLQEAFCKQFE